MSSEANPQPTDDHFGITPRSYRILIQAIEEERTIERAEVFGSRAMGNAKHGSDIDLALFGAAVDADIAARLSRRLNEREPIPYYVDVVAYDAIENPALTRHIDEQGRVLFRRS